MYVCDKYFSMKTQISEHIDLTHPELYRLVIETHPEQFSFYIYPLTGNSEGFFYRIPKRNQSDGFACFTDFFFENSFLTLSFNQVQILNYTPVFTSVPAILFDEKDKNEYMKFLFVENTGKILSHTIQKAEMILLHEMPEETYRFFQRSFGSVHVFHHTAPLIASFYDKGDFVDGNRMIINRKKQGLDILCFSHDRLLMCNHFQCSDVNEAFYYVLFIWKQLKFNQQKDYISIAEENSDLSDLLKQYIRRVNPVEFASEVPLEMAALRRCEI